jgi:hypothetical protein
VSCTLAMPADGTYTVEFGGAQSDLGAVTGTGP